MDINVLVNKMNEFERERRYILGIDGLSRAGKTSIVTEIGQYLKERNQSFHIFHMDELIVQRIDRYNTGHEEWFEYFQLQWNTQWLKDNLFRKLKESRDVLLPFYCNESDTHSNRKVILPKTGLIIVEGVFLQRDEWKEFFDFVVYMDCTREIRFKRESLSTQQNIKKFEERYWKAEDYYLQKIQPLAHADLVLVSGE
ncbi:hypothetical protein FZW96_12750 [Bacillus sp. BGMRC 2118]|nr:hypothetical protein FZW96_12750 [Bacillus sp. BGMRC 2118]